MKALISYRVTIPLLIRIPEREASLYQRHWSEILLPPGNSEHTWEQFHENSKNGHYSVRLADEEVLAKKQSFHLSLPYEGYPAFALPSVKAIDVPVSAALISRRSCRVFKPQNMMLHNLATVLYFAYGVNDLNQKIVERTVPSAGGLYPLEIYFHNALVTGLDVGLYHYNPIVHEVRHLVGGDQTKKLSDFLLQPEIGRNTSVTIFITSVFERCVFKYGDRGYRYIFLEAGHVAQNINLVATALGLGCVNIGGFFDRDVDDFLDLDGVTHSTIYVVAIGGLPHR